jgi:hypothetical protein
VLVCERLTLLSSTGYGLLGPGTTNTPSLQDTIKTLCVARLAARSKYTGRLQWLPLSLPLSLLPIQRLCYVYGVSPLLKSLFNREVFDSQPFAFVLLDRRPHTPV